MKRIYGKLTLIVHRVYLRVKFPCSISLLLRKENQELRIGQEVPLRLGEAIFQVSTNLDIETTYDYKQQRFDQKKFFIEIYLKTMIGRVPAGIAYFDLHQIKRGTNSLKINIERCPDKEASMLINVVYEVWNQVPAFSQFEDTEHRYSERNMIQDLNKMRESPEDRYSSLVEKLPQNILQQNQFIPLLSIGKQESPTRSNQGPEKSPYKVNINESSLLHQSNRGRSSTKDREYKNLQRKYEQQIVQLKGILAKSQVSDRNLRENDHLIKSLKEKNQDLKLSNESLARKMQFTQSNLREQLKNISNKLTNSEAQKQRFIYEKNDMINRFGERQRAVRELLREKEKINSEQKFSNSKKIETISNQLQLYKSKSHQLQLKAKELQRQLEVDRQNHNINQQEKRKLNQLINQLKQSLMNQKNERKRLQQELDSNTKLEEQKKKFKKRMNQLEQELAKKIRNLATAENNCQKQMVKNEQLENKLKQQQSSNKSEKKQNEKLKKQIEQLTKQLKSLNQAFQSKSQAQTHQNAQLNDRLNNQEQMIRKLQNSMKKSAKQIQEKNALLQNLQQKILNSNDQLKQLQKYHLQLRQEHFKLRILNSQNVNNKQQIKSQKLQIEIQLESFIKELQNKELEFKSQIEKRQAQKADLETKVRQLEQKLSQSNGESTFQIQTFNSKVQQLTRQVQKRSEELQTLEKYAKKLSAQNKNGTAQIQRLQEIISTFQGQIQKLGDHNQQLLKSIQELQVHLNEVQQYGEGNQEQLYKKTQKIKNLQNQLEQLQKLNNQYLTDIEEKSNQIHCLSDALDSQQERNRKLYKDSSSHIAELKQDHKLLVNNNQTLHQQLEQTEQAYKQISNDLESTHRKLEQQIKINSGLVSQMATMEQNFHQQKESLLKNSSSEGNKLLHQMQQLQQKLHNKEVQFTTQTALLKQAIQISEQHYENLTQQHQSFKEKSEFQISRLNRNLTEVTNTKLQLQEKLAKLSKAGEMKEKTYQVQTEYIKPIRQNLILLKGYMNEYSRVGDQFEANKNKLLKMATVKIEQYTDRNVAEKVKEVSSSFQRLKASILGNGQLGEQQKLKLSEQFKKVQFSLDRALRGDR